MAVALHELGYLKSAKPDYFTDSVWALLNPRRTLTVKNAVIYDVLLLFSYKVSMSAPQFAAAVGEYLYKMYTEQLQIDVDRFAKTPTDLDNKAVLV